MLEVRIYATESGSRPFAEWLDGLRDRRGRSIVKARTDRLSFGDLGRYRSVGDGVMELKVYFGPGYRVYFGRIDDTLILLLCGGDKGSQSRDILRAKEYLEDYRRELNAEEK